MSDSVAKWDGNDIKCFLLFFDAGTKTVIQILRWLYVGPTRIEDHLVDLVQKWPQKFYSIEVKALVCLKEDRIVIEEISLPLLLKISLLLCGGSVPENVVQIWTPQLCKSENRDEMNTLLLRLNEEHRNLRNLRKNGEYISESFVLNKSEELKDLLTLILQKAGRDISDTERNGTITNIRSDIDVIFHIENCEFSSQNFSKYVILNDLENLQTHLYDGLRVYSIPELTLLDNEINKVPLEAILSDHNTNVIVVLGKSGIGKTSLTKFLFNSWKCGGLESSIKKLSDFDVVLKVECKKIRNQEIFEYFQNCFPISSFLLSNSSRLMKLLEDLKILWIIDGYDECTAEFKSFMTTLTKRMSKGHKVLITSRPNKHEALKTSINGLSQLTLSIDMLNESNIDEITKHYIAEEKSFKEWMNSLGDAEKSCLRVPLNLSLCTELWLNDSDLLNEPFSAMTLYRKSTEFHLQKLIDNDSCLSVSPSPTDGVVQRWFYGSLCRQSFLSAMRWDNTFNNKTLETLVKDASDAGLVATDMLSAFLIETHGSDGKKNYDFKHCEQQYILASLFLRYFNKYQNSPMKDLLNNAQIYPALQILKFYIEMAIDDDSINSDIGAMFDPILELSLIFKPREQNYIWCSTSVTAKFNKRYMEVVARGVTSLAHLDTSIFETYLEISEFLKYVHPKKIRIVNYNTFEPKERDEFLSLLEVLKEQQSEIHLHTSFDELNDVKGTSEIDAINEASLRVTSFTGTMMEFPFLSNHHSSLETLELMIHSEEEFLQLCEVLFGCDTLTDIQLYILFDSFSSSVPVTQFPEELLSNTTLSFRRLTEDNFDNFIFFLTEIKGDESFKFKALFHCMDQISERQKQLLDEIASLVVFERCPYSKSLNKEAEFKIYSFPVEFHEVHSWRYCYSTYRNR